MSQSDPHVHVERTVGATGAARDLMASAFGLVTDSPSTVTTGCELRVPYAMTSADPGRVTCLACREHAHREHLRLADQIDGLSGMPGVEIPAEQMAKAVQWHRDRAAKFVAG
jgi:hypothetical protein